MSFRHSLKRGFATLRISTNAKVPTQTFQHTTTSPFPTIPQCPPATCSCRPMPQDLDISPRPFDRTVAPYSEHILIHTGRSDWPSKIEDDNRNTIPHELKRLFKPGSQYHDPYSRILVSNSSFKLFMTSGFEPRTVSLLRSGWHVGIPADHSVASFVEAFLSTKHESTSKDDFTASKISEVTVLICGHSRRDKRCGVMGPLLQAEFEEKLRMLGVSVLGDPPGSLYNMQGAPAEDEKTDVRARVGLVSHVGGHAFAGNVIIYVPCTAQTHPLAGLGVWYGRVQPRHVEGIVQQTILGGNLIQELLRGTVLATASHR